MCDQKDEAAVASYDRGQSDDAVAVATLEGDAELIDLARQVCAIPERRSAHLGSIGYGSTTEGDRVLVAVDRQYDHDVVEAIATALRARGATVDVHWLDNGADRRFQETDEIDVTIRRSPWRDRPRRWEGNPRIEELAEREGYDLLIHGRGGPTPPTPFRYEQIPWLRREHFSRGVVAYPSQLIAAAAQKTWDLIWLHGRDGRVRLTDGEGTDITYGLPAVYWDGTHHGWVPEPKRWYGHLFGHPTPPLPQADAHGVVKGTTSHFSRAFPQIELQLRDGKVTGVTGGGGYGQGWGALLEETRATKYPGFPTPGLFHLWEAAIGGHPKVTRPQGIEYWSSGGFEWERRRSGVVHLGFGTFWRGSDEEWAAERGLAYGHLHVHLLTPTFEVTSADGDTHVLVRDGRLTALDDPEIRRLAERLGDPDELLSEAWQPSIPGVTAPGSYEEFAADPAAWIYADAPGG